MSNRLITNNIKTTNSIKLEKPPLELIKKKYIKLKFNKSNKCIKFTTFKSKLTSIKTNYIYINYKNKCNYKVKINFPSIFQKIKNFLLI